MNEDEQNDAGSGQGRSPSRNTTHSQMQNSPFSPAPLRFPSSNRQYVTQPAMQGESHIQEQTERYPGFAYGHMQPAQQNVHRTATYQPGLQAQPMRLFQQQPQTVGVPEMLRPDTYTPIPQQDVHQTPTYQAGLHAQPFDPSQPRPLRIGAGGTHTYVGAPLSPADVQGLRERTEQQGATFIYQPRPHSPAPPQTPPQYQPQNRPQEPSAEQVPLQQQNPPRIHPQADRPRRGVYRREHHDAQDESDSSSLQMHEQGPNAISNANVQQPDFNIAGYPENPGYDAGDDVTSDEFDNHHDQVFTGFGRPSPAQSPDLTPYYTTAGNLQTPSVDLFRSELNEREPTNDLPQQNLGQSTADQSNTTRVRGDYHGQWFATVHIGSQRQGLGQEFHTTSGAIASTSRSEATQFALRSEASQFTPRSEAIQFPARLEATQFASRSEATQFLSRPQAVPFPSQSEALQFPQSESVQPQRQPEYQHHIQHHAAESVEEDSSYNTSLEDAFRCNVGDENYPPSGEEDSDYYRQQRFSDHEEPGRSNALANLGPSNENHPPAGPSNYEAGARPGQYNHQRDLAQSEQVNPRAAYPMQPAASVPAPVPTPTPAAITRLESHNQVSAPLATGIKLKDDVVFRALTGRPTSLNDPRRIAREKRRDEKREAAEEKRREKKERGGRGFFGLFKKEGSTAAQPQPLAKCQTLPAERRLEAAFQQLSRAGTLPAPAAAITPLVRANAGSPTAFGGWGPPRHPPPTGPLPRTPVCRHCQSAECPRCYYCHELGCDLCWYCHQAECQHQPLATLHPPHRS